LFEKGISARKFASTPVDVFEQNIEGSVWEGYRKQIGAAHVEKAREGP